MSREQLLVKDCPQCKGCKLAELFPNRMLVPPKMGHSLRLVVAEAAGEQEEVDGTPLVGPAGKLFDSLLRKANISRDSLTLSNTLSCRPPNNSYPTDDSARAYSSKEEGEQIVAHCYEKHLKPLLDSRPWERIDAVGAHSLKVLTGKEGIMKWRGSVLPLRGHDVPNVMPTLHPSYLMRDQAMIPAAISDLQKGIQVPPQFYNLKPTMEDLESFDPTFLTLDIETNRYTKEITMVGISNRPNHVLVVPFRGPYIGQLRRIIASAKDIVGQNLIQFDLKILEDNSIQVSQEVRIWDIMLMHHLLHPDEAHDLEYIASIYTQMQAWKHLQHEDMAWYNACDVDATIQSYRAMLPVLKQQGLLRLYELVQVPLAKICALMGATGLKVDRNRIKKARDQFEAELKELELTLPIELQPYDKAIKVREKAPEGTLGKSGKPIKYIHIPSTERVTPWDSPKQVEKYLYETLKLPIQRHPKTKKVTSDKNALARLYKQTQRKEIDAIRCVRQLGELIGTFLQDETESKQVAIGRIHSNFLVHGTSTGRLASSGPNLQNIPSKARYIYVPSHSDWCFIEADFSSLENRLAAWYANDTQRLHRLSDPSFNEHRALASLVYNLPEASITKEMHEYKMGKIANHGADGAMGPRKLAITHGIPEKDAKELILAWKKLNPQSARWQEETGNRASKEGRLTNAFGRKRWFWSHSAYTEGIRFLPQSTGADICYRAMIGLFFDRILWPIELACQASPILAPVPYPARLVLQVHDSILIESPYGLVPDVVSCLRQVMSQPWPELAGFAIPVEVKVGVPGASWAELKTYKEGN
jgi:uracil-DNA glycosylase family 4